MTRARVALLAAALVWAPVARADPPCSARVVVEPETAFVGEQVVYRLQILQRREIASLRFVRELAFPSFRAEWLPGQSPDPAIGDVGDHALVSEERRALFPVRSGDLAIPAARLACRSAAETIEIDVPESRVRVRDVPDRGRPADFGGIVGPVVLHANLAGDRVALGASLDLVVTALGAGNLFALGDPLDPARDLPGVDVYARPPETERETGRGLEVRRAFRYALVPRAVGRFALPPLRVAYFDPESESYAAAETPALAFEVVAPAPDAAPPVTPSTVRAAGASRIGARPWLATGAALATAAIGARIARARSRRRAARRAAAPLLAEAIAARERGDAAGTARALAAALRAALATRLPGAASLAVEEIAARNDTSMRRVADALAALDRARFGGAADRARAADVERVAALIRSL